MIALDSCVLLRYLDQEDHHQGPMARLLVNSLSAVRPGFISTIALAELVWELRGIYTREQTIAMIDGFLHDRRFKLESPDTVYRAMTTYAANKLDFGDCLMGRAAHAAGCEYVATFDRKAARTAGYRDLEILSKPLPFK